MFCCGHAEAYEGDQLRQLVAALCPTIYGHELVKAGLLLSLFGGVRKHGSSNNRVSAARLLVAVHPVLRHTQYASAVACGEVQCRAWPSHQPCILPVLFICESVTSQMHNIHLFLVFISHLAMVHLLKQQQNNMELIARPLQQTNNGS